MRLSEAIRLGAMLSPQTRGAFFVMRGQETATCALGAAAEAVGRSEIEVLRLSARWPILRLMVPLNELPHELRASRPHSLADVIMRLNDRAGWTRTRIADWVEKFEAWHAEMLAGVVAELEQQASAVPESADEQDGSEDTVAVCV